MGSRVLTVAAAVASLWASAAWSATSVPDNGAAVTLAPGAASSPAGIFDPNFPGTTLLLEPQATTIPLSLGNGAVDDLASGATLHDVRLTLAPNVELHVGSVEDNYLGWRSPFAAGGAYAGISFKIADDLQLHFGHAAFGANAPGESQLAAYDSALPPELALQLAKDEPGAETTTAGIDWAFADWGGLDLTASQTKETGALLGGVETNSVAVTNAIQTAALGISARVGFGDGWVTTVSYSQGISQLNLRPNTLLPAPDELKSQSYGLSVAKQGLFGDDMLGLTLSRPALGSGPSLMSGFVDNGNSLLGNNWGMSADAPESDLELGYVTSFLGGSLALQANAAYQMNAGGQRGQDAVTVVSRAKINF